MFYLLFAPLPSLADGLTGGPVQGKCATRHAVFMASFAVLLIFACRCLLYFVRAVCRDDDGKSVCRVLVVACRGCFSFAFVWPSDSALFQAVAISLPRRKSGGKRCPCVVRVTRNCTAFRRFSWPYRKPSSQLYCVPFWPFDTANLRRYF